LTVFCCDFCHWRLTNQVTHRRPARLKPRSCTISVDIYFKFFPKTIHCQWHSNEIEHPVLQDSNM